MRLISLFKDNEKAYINLPFKREFFLKSPLVEWILIFLFIFTVLIAVCGSHFHINSPYYQCFSFSLNIICFFFLNIYIGVKWNK
ncbi:hypothetical protein BTB_502p00730 (plasmid) [Bacillus thuringiensis Bt407]|uniref:Uncharacterized protein n=1 Tax=Bacillus thuringiensis T01-328 TaxID=1324966 RepID=A0AAN4HKI7_BACTU|nr:hypothetical protein BTB_502p00730 [Bacillus thuringiensis Bt407]ERI01415.1 hypothetical protein BTCBT_003003 [Bacillus thuringiensis T01-328]PQZ78219.1 hypothetical protein CQ064_10430 [Bacillus sp. MYb78]